MGDNGILTWQDPITWFWHSVFPLLSHNIQKLRDKLVISLYTSYGAT